MDIKQKIETMLKLRDEIISEARTWDKLKPCPLNDPNIYISHSQLANMFDLDAGWYWNCPFCGKEWEE
jgi:hypothetical protein